jgi:hypothetical protein
LTIYPSSCFWRTRSALRQRVDLRVGREAAGGLFGEFQLAIDGHLEHAAARADQFDISNAKPG